MASPGRGRSAELVRSVIGVGLAVSLLAGCGGSHSDKGSKGSKGSTSGDKVASGGTFTMATNADPGNLDPQASAASNLFEFSQFAYDPLVSLTNDGKIVSALASSWMVQSKQAVLQLRDKVTCSDGTPFTAADAAANLNYLADPKNKSPFLGVFLPVGAKATTSGSTLTIALAGPAPFLLEGLSNVPMVCRSGMANRSALAHHTLGTGPYQLTESVAGDHLSLTKRAGYNWGPGGASTDTAGMPDKVVLKVISNETTAANLLLSGGLNAATVLGPDSQRLAKSGLFAAKQSSLLGEMWFNHAAGRPAADRAVRLALTQALDLPQLAKVLTSGDGTEGTTLAAVPPVACPGSSVAGTVPSHDLTAAKKTLDDAGWAVGSGGSRAKNGKPLAITFTYNTGLGSGGSAAAELASAAWRQLGAKVTMRAEDETAAVTTLFTSGDWDVAWEALNVNSPDQLVPFMSGPAVPKGNNFAHIENAAYRAGVSKAMALQGTAGCGAWLDAEKNLIKDADVIPFANRVGQTFGKHAKFDSGGVPVIPTSIRMLKS